MTFKMKDNFYYTTHFLDCDVPYIERTNYMGLKFDEVIESGGYQPHRTFRQAIQQHKKNLKEMIRLCQEELEKTDSLTPENIQQGEVH